MSLFGKNEKIEIENLKKEISNLQMQLLPENNDLKKLQKQIAEASAEKDLLDRKILELQEQLSRAKADLVETEETVLLQSFGLYEPHFSFTNSDEYKDRLQQIREEQKILIKSKNSMTGYSSWSVNGNAAQGRKMIADMQKCLLRAFNAECDQVIEHVKYNNMEASEKRITLSRDAISKLGAMMGITIGHRYYSLKLDELHLAFEYQQKKQEEKEAQKEARAQLKEAEKLAKEIEAARKKLEKEQTHYQNALLSINSQLAAATDEDRPAIEAKKEQLERQLEKIDQEFKDVDYREANQKAGYVYVISNIGAFGENVYKIGMTRRLNPMDRVDELGDASVPFNFDVHAMIFSDNAPKLEAALHNAFADRKLNFVNQRREFFRVSLQEIKDVIKENFDGSVEFVEFPPAEQYRESLLLQKSFEIEK